MPMTPPSQIAPAKSRIRILPPELQNQIAAGEVVERPASALKELVENSLDAGATRIEAAIVQGGRALIEVFDNGRGMTPQELALALTRHATSKISELSDLTGISSYGFRGEALPSIASVSRFRIVSRPQGEEDAWFLDIVNGRTEDQGPTVLAPGTRIEARDLFAGVPARLKFLKSEAVESRRCAEIFGRIALARLDVAFKLTLGGRTAFDFPAGQALGARLAGIWPPAATEGLAWFSRQDGGYTVEGLAGAPMKAQTRPDRMLFYVNGRAVQDRILLRAVREAYKGRLLSREYPQCLIFLSVPPEDLDVNAHPAKTEVRFRDESRLFSVTRRAVMDGLDRAFALKTVPAPPEYLNRDERPKLPSVADFKDCLGYGERIMPQDGPYGPASQSGQPLCPADRPGQPTPAAAAGPWPPVRGNEPERQDQAKRSYPGSRADASPAWRESNGNPAAQDISAQPPSLAPAPTGHPAEHSFRSHEAPGEPEAPLVSSGPEAMHGQGYAYLGQIAETYLILRLENGSLALVDQHAAHERVLHTAMAQAGTKGHSRPLGFPLELGLHPSEQARLDEIWPRLCSMGFNLSRPSQETLAVAGIPPGLSVGQAREYLQAALAGQAKSIEDLWALLSCKAAIKAGTRLAREEAMSLLESWIKTPDREYCPHGRPVIVHFSVSELERLFKRKR